MSNRNKLISRAKRIFTLKASCIAGESSSSDSGTPPTAAEGCIGNHTSSSQPITQPLIPYGNSGSDYNSAAHTPSGPASPPVAPGDADSPDNPVVNTPHLSPSSILTAYDSSLTSEECQCPTHIRRRRWLLPLRRRRQQNTPCVYCRRQGDINTSLTQPIPHLETTENSGLDRDANFVIPTLQTQSSGLS